MTGKANDNGPPPAVTAPSSLTQTELRDLAVTHALPNGTSILIRAIRPDDKAGLLAAFGNLERKSIYTRFFGHRKELPEAELEQVTNVDFDQIVALVATISSGEAETIIAEARYVRDVGNDLRPGAEVAFIVADDFQGQGIASCLLGHLVRIARGKGLSHFDADVLDTNRPMLAVFARSGLPLRQQIDSGVVRVVLSLDAGQS